MKRYLSVSLTASVALFAAAPFSAYGRALGEVVALIEEQNRVFSSVVIAYQVNELSEPVGQNSDEVARQIADYKNALEEVDASVRDEMVKSYSHSLNARVEKKREGVFVLCPEFFANNLSEANGLSIWEIRRGTNRYRIVGNQSLSIFSDQGRNRRDFADTALESIGVLGKLNESLVATLKGKETKLTESNEEMSLTNGNLTVELKKVSDQFVLSSVQKLVPEFKQKELILFGDYRETAGKLVPFQVTFSFEGDGRRISRTFNIQDIVFGGEYSVPLVNQDIGLINVHDARFEPPIDYLAISQLPDDKQIVEWITEPSVLRKHNETLQKLRK